MTTIDPGAAGAHTTCTVHVPVRACDVGGWTDTWFARRGLVCSLAVGPGVTVDARSTPGDGVVTLDVPDLGGPFTVADAPAEHRLLVEAVAEAGGAPGGHDVRLTIRSAVPPATSLGTSASVCVGVLAALDVLRTGAIRPPGDLAAAAHRVESERVGRQCGVQDQVAAAHRGANRIEVDHPAATVHPIELGTALRSALDERLLHVAYGGRHDSSAVHEQVIAELEGEGADAAPLDRLRQLAAEAHQALVEADLDAYGRALTGATEAQAGLHPDLVSDDAHALIDLARSVGATGWKVNGAAGAAGSISILCRSAADRSRLEDLVRHAGHLPLSLTLRRRGAHVR